MAKVSISESKLNEIIIESIREALEDEGLRNWLGNKIGGGVNKAQGFVRDFRNAYNQKRATMNPPQGHTDDGSTGNPSETGNTVNTGNTDNTGQNQQNTVTTQPQQPNARKKNGFTAKQAKSADELIQMLSNPANKMMSAADKKTLLSLVQQAKASGALQESKINKLIAEAVIKSLNKNL